MNLSLANKTSDEHGCVITGLSALAELRELIPGSKKIGWDECEELFTQPASIRIGNTIMQIIAP